MKKEDKGLTTGKLVMMALGSVIGGSFFLGTSVAINAAGPAILVAYIFGGILTYFILYALSEMTVANPDSGSFRTFTAQSFGPGAGFVLGWIYWVGMVLGMSSEATAAAILVRQWFPNASIPILGGSIIIGVTLLNLLGADMLSKLESGLAAVKLFTIVAFIILAALLIIGFMPGIPAVGLGEVRNEALMPNGIGGVAGSMLIVIFAYAGFEVIGLAASETKDPVKTIPKAITYTVIALVGIYILTAAAILPLIPTSVLNEKVSPIVAALSSKGMGWISTVINVVLITAIISTMLASMFGLGRITRSQAEEGDAPRWIRDKTDVPYRGILFSGVGMLAGLWLGLLFPRVYLFLISSGGFATLYTYAFILATHIKHRKEMGCPPHGKCQMPGFPYTSWFALISIIAIIFSMPLIPGQASGLVIGIVLVAVFYAAYFIKKYMANIYNKAFDRDFDHRKYKAGYSEEMSKELSDDAASDDMKNKGKKLDNNNKDNKNGDCGCKDK